MQYHLVGMPHLIIEMTFNSLIDTFCNVLMDYIRLGLTVNTGIIISEAYVNFLKTRDSPSLSLSSALLSIRPGRGGAGLSVCERGDRESVKE